MYFALEKDLVTNHWSIPRPSETTSGENVDQILENIILPVVFFYSAKMFLNLFSKMRFLFTIETRERSCGGCHFRYLSFAIVFGVMASFLKRHYVFGASAWQKGCTDMLVDLF